MMASKIMLAAALVAMATTLVHGDCAADSQTCISALSSSCQSGNFQICCGAIPTYSQCLSNACGLPKDQLDNLMNEQLKQMGIKCGSCVVKMAALPVLLVALVAVVFNIRG